MKINFLVISDKVVNGEIDFKLKELGEVLSKKGVESDLILIKNFSSEIANKFILEDFVQDNYCYIICEDKNVDGLIRENITKLGKDHRIVDEQAVLFYKDNAKLMMIPIECDYLRFIDYSLNDISNDILVMNIFGKNKFYISDYLNNLKETSKNFEYKIYQDGILCEVILKFARQDTLFDYNIKQEILSYFENSIYSDDGRSLSNIAFSLLKEKAKTIAFAESMTGGNVASTLIKENRGASKYVKECLVTYQKSAKVELLDVDREILNKYSAESSETTFEMAKNLLKKARTDYVVAITGLASNTKNEEGGKCFIAIGNSEEIHMFKSKFSGTRKEIIEKATQTAFYYLIQTLRKK